MLIVRVGSTTRIPVRLIDSTGTGVTGIDGTAINGGVATLVKSDGTMVDITVSIGTNWFEIDSAKAPGLYHLSVAGTNLSTVGPTQLCVVPTAVQFVVSVGAFLVEDIEPQLTLIRKIQTNRWKIVGTTLVIYDDDKVTPLKTFNLLDDTGSPSNTRIFERTY